MFLACCFFTCPSREPIFCYVLHLLCAVHWCALGLRLRLMFHTPSPEPSRAEPRREAAVRCIVCTRMFSSLLRHFLRSSAAFPSGLRRCFGNALATGTPLSYEYFAPSLLFFCQYSVQRTVLDILLDSHWYSTLNSVLAIHIGTSHEHKVPNLFRTNRTARTAAS